jgi:hypothetical protein|tara:strand:+ start:1036 stop:1161 length:126 start_codon:yes stop_codon:yes gene_type:complete
MNGPGKFSKGKNPPVPLYAIKSKPSFKNLKWLLLIFLNEWW